jgi:hypothetical protein
MCSGGAWAEFLGGQNGLGGRKNGLQANFREQSGPIHIENVHFLHGLGGPRPTLAPMKLRHCPCAPNPLSYAAALQAYKVQTHRVVHMLLLGCDFFSNLDVLYLYCI